MQLKRKKRQAGDTLVEVLLAFSIFGAAAVTITRTMNEGYSQMFVSGQQSQVQTQMRGQLAIIQAAHDAEVKDPNSRIWNDIIDEISGIPSEKQTAVNADGCTYTLHKNRIYFETGSGGTWTQPQKRPAATDPAHQAVSVSTVTPKPDGNSMWIEAKYTPPNLVTNSRGYYDFYAKGCWSHNQGNRQLKTVMRLYDLVAPAGEGSVLTPTPPAPDTTPVDPINIPGSGYLFGACRSNSPLEGDEFNESPPSGPLFSSSPNTHPCTTAGDPSTVYTCTNYDIEYPSNVVRPGRYLLTLSYRDALCGSGVNDPLAGTGYSYYLQVFLNGNLHGSMILSSNTISATYPFNSLNPGDTIGFRWWNNRWIYPGVGVRDPDLVISNLRLVYIP